MTNSPDLPPYPHHVEPFEAGAVLTSSMLRERLAKISDMCVTGNPVGPIRAELAYLVSALPSR